MIRILLLFSVAATFALSACQTKSDNYSSIYLPQSSVERVGEDPVLNPVSSPPQDAAEQISQYVRRIHQDRNGHFWFATNSDGVCRYDGQKLACFSVENGLSGQQVTAIMEDKAGNLWFTTSGGISRFDGKQFTNFGEQEGLKGTWACSMLQDSKGVIWAGTVEGLFRLKEDRFVPVRIRGSLLGQADYFTAPAAVWAIAEDAGGKLWLGTFGQGVFRFDGQNFDHFTSSDGLCDNSVSGILPAKNGDIWFATAEGGVCRYDGRQFHNVTETAGLAGLEVWSVYEDRSGNIWFPSEGFGVYRYDGQSFQNFSPKNGLDMLAVQCIYEDRDGQLWLGGGNGLFRREGTGFVNVLRGGPWN